MSMDQTGTRAAIPPMPVRVFDTLRGPQERLARADRMWTSIHLFMFYICLFYAIQPLIYIWLNSASASIQKLFVYSRAAFVLFSIVLLIMRPVKRNRSFNPLIILGLSFPLYIFTTVLWTVNMQDTTQSALFTSCYILFGYFFGQRIGVEEAVRALARFGFVVVALSLLVSVLVPRIGQMSAHDAVEAGHAGNWRGVFPHKNILGSVVAIIFVLFSTYPRCISPRRSIQILAIICALTCLIFSKSANGLVSSIVIVLAFYVTRIPAARTWFGMGTLVILSTLVFAITNGDVSAILGAMGRNTTFTGRTVIWKMALEQVGVAPWLGQGYGAVGINILHDKLISGIGPSAVNVHSGYLYMLTEAGGLGTALFLAMVVVAAISGLNALAGSAKSQKRARVESLLAVTALFFLLAVAEITFVPDRMGALFFLVLGLLYGETRGTDVQAGEAAATSAVTEVFGRPRRVWSSLPARR